MEKNRNIIVFGGTGFYGRKIVEKLIQKNLPVKVVTRNASKARYMFGNSVELFEGDITNKDTIVKSLQNIDVIIIALSAVHLKLIRKMKEIERDAVLNILDEAKNQNISRIIYLSVYDLHEPTLHKLNIYDFAAIKIEIENIIKKSDFNWTILGCAPAHELLFAFYRKGKVAVPGGGYNAFATISPEDVGEIASQTAIRNDLKHMRLRLTGNEAISFPEVAKRLSKILSKEIKHVAIPLAIVNIVSKLALIFTPYVRYLYKSLKLLNNFPEEFANEVPNNYQKLQSMFDYSSVTINMEIEKRYKENKL